MESVLLLKNELWIAVVIFLLLFIKIGMGMKNDSLLTLIQVLLFVNVVIGFLFSKEGSAFSGMFYSDAVVAFQKNILSIATFLISLLCADWLKKTPHLAEFFVLLLCAQLGMFFMISSGNLLMFYLGLELSTIPVAALGNFDLEKRISSEAAMKMILSSAFSTGILLFGISLVYGATGTISFNELPQALSSGPLQILALVFLVSAFAFKLSVVPFHLWTADVYEGAPVAVTSWLSVISKGSVLFVFVAFLNTVFRSQTATWYNMLFVLSVLTILIGNLFAIRQNNIKRFLAFSSIAQIGFILVGITGSPHYGIASVVYFVLVYVFSNLAAFGVVALVSAVTGREQVSDYKGFYKTNPVLSWVLTIALFSLAGVPPTAGFFGKFFLLLSGAGKGNYILITIAALNMILSFYYYLRIVKAIFMDANEQPIERLSIPAYPKLAMIICVTGIIVTGLAGYIYDYIYSLTWRF